ncbi:MAG TPA: hypothetical protein VK638_46465 [Edaphobacter sp.]|nr:hypothetical protein [Edaphobacter sp.]
MGTLLTWMLLSCGPAELRPARRPSAVPGDAVWAGGADGGAYIKCTYDVARDVDRCSVWNDYTGQTDGPGDYRLEKQHRAATASELKFTGAVNEFIYLQNGLTLKRQ